MERLWLPATVLAMEGAWLSAVAAVWARWLDGSDARPLLPFAAALATLVAGHVAGRQVLCRDEPAAEGGRAPMPCMGARLWLVFALGCCWSIAIVWLGRHAGEGPAWLAAAFQAAGEIWRGPTPDLAGLLFALLLWWRGQRVGATPPEYAEIMRSFGSGALLLATALALAAASPAQFGAEPIPLVAVALFLVSGLLALAFSRLQEVRRDLAGGAVRGDPARLAGSSAARGFRAVAPPVAFVLAAALVAAYVFGDDTWRRAMLDGLGRAGLAAWNVLYWPLLAVGYLAEWLVYLVRRLPHRESPLERPPGPPGLWEALRQEVAPRPPVSDAWLVVLRWGAVAFVALAIAASFLATSRLARRERSSAAGGREDRESLWSWRSAWQSLRQALGGRLWSWLRRWLARGRQVTALAAGAAGRGRDTATREDALAVDARAAYRRLLVAGRDQGTPRLPHQTPDEYLATWRSALPGEREAGELTAAYLPARYGHPDSPAAPPGALRAALARLLAALDARRHTPTK